jgi:hypothetical protein
MSNKVKGNLIQLICIPVIFLSIILGIYFRTLWVPVSGLVILIFFLCWGSRVYGRQEIRVITGSSPGSGKPTWITVVGVLAIILSCFGILGGGQLMMMSKIRAFQQEMLVGMQEDFQKQDMRAARMFKTMEKMWDAPDWYDTWNLIVGMITLVVSGFYLFAAICFLQLKKYAIKLFYFALAISIVLTLLKIVVSMVAMPSLLLFIFFGGSFGLIVNIVLLIVVATNNKEAFQQVEVEPL